MIVKHIIVSGYVQGVFFRQSTQTVARDIGCRGWIKNEMNGTVSVYVIGTEPQFQALSDFLRQGPPMARVDDMTITDASFDPSVLDFLIRY